MSNANRKILRNQWKRSTIRRFHDWLVKHGYRTKRLSIDEYRAKHDTNH